MKARYAFLGAVLLAAALAACGGGGGGGGNPPTTAPTSTPTQGPTANPTGSVTLSGSPSTLPIPSGFGVSGTFAIPGGSGSGTLTGSNTPPSPAPEVQLMPRKSFAQTGNTAVYYVTLTATSALTMNGIPGITVTLPSTAKSGTYYVAYYSTSYVTPAGQQPAWVSSSTTGASGGPNQQIVIPATTTPVVTLATGQSLYLAVYYGNYIPPINTQGCVGVQSAPYTGTHASQSELTGTIPITSGDTYTYNGSLSQTISRSSPCPQPQTTANASVTINVAMSGSSETSMETDAYATNTTAVNTVASIAQSGGSPNVYTESSETSTDGNGNTTLTTYSPALQYAQTPEGKGNTWTNGPPASVNQTLADGTTLIRTYGIGGSFYGETDTIPGGTYGTYNVISANNDGSGWYWINGPTPATPAPTATSPAGALLVSMAAPSRGSISVTFGTQTPLVIQNWLPTTGLYSDVTNDMGAGTLPSNCTTVTSPGTVEHLQRVIQLADPVLGYIENETVDRYDLVNYTGGVTLGPVCASITDTLSNYYDWSLATTGIYFALNAQPISVNTITESIGLSATGLKAQLAGRSSAAQAFAAQIAAREAGISFTRSMQRAQTLKAVSQAAAAHLIVGGVR